MKICDLKSAVEYLKSFTSYEDIILNKYDESKFDLKRFRKFLRDYGVRYEGLRAIHVAGSKGKGTTASLVAKYLERKGYKVGLFTSPYIIDITEGISINGEMISEARFLRYVNGLKKFIDDSGLVENGQMVTYFELLTAIMFQYFLDSKVDFAVLEVGLGGRLDSTNVCSPVATVLTSVEKEHEKLLGRTYAKILNEKLGIVKKGVPLIVAHQKPFVEREIKSRKLGVRVVFASVGDPNFEGAKAVLLDLAGRKFIDELDEGLFLKLYHSLSLVGRFDVVKFKMRGSSERAECTVVFDMAHTVDSARYLRKKLDSGFPGNKFVFLISMMRDKRVGEFLDELNVFKNRVVFTTSHSSRGYTGEELCKKFYKKAEVKEGPLEAFSYALKILRPDQVLVVTGSHFLVGEILRALKRKLF